MSERRKISGMPVPPGVFVGGDPDEKAKQTMRNFINGKPAEGQYIEKRSDEAVILETGTSILIPSLGVVKLFSPILATRVRGAKVDQYDMYRFLEEEITVLRHVNNVVQRLKIKDIPEHFGLVTRITKK